jgi:hypothetical protein
MSLEMSKEERDAFLAEVHVAVISVPESGRGPLTVPVWYKYDPSGEFQIWTLEKSRKVGLLREAGRFSLCVQHETPPYKYVSVEGPVVIEPVQFERDIKPMVYRYLGPEAGDKYIESMGGEAAERGGLLLRMKPDRWISEDHSKIS